MHNWSGAHHQGAPKEAPVSQVLFTSLTSLTQVLEYLIRRRYKWSPSAYNLAKKFLCDSDFCTQAELEKAAFESSLIAKMSNRNVSILFSYLRNLRDLRWFYIFHQQYISMKRVLLATIVKPDYSINMPILSTHPARIVHQWSAAQLKLALLTFLQQ